MHNEIGSAISNAVFVHWQNLSIYLWTINIRNFLTEVKW